MLVLLASEFGFPACLAAA